MRLLLNILIYPASLLVTGVLFNSGSMGNNTGKDSAMQSGEETFFKGGGKQPEWTLTLNTSTLQLQAPEEGLEISGDYEFHQGNENGMHIYTLNSEDGILEIQLKQSQYRVKFPEEQDSTSITWNWTPKDQSPVISHTGSGRYQMSRRLHDIWVLDSLSGFMPKELPADRPRMELFSRSQHFSLSEGCDELRGNLVWEPGILFFTSRDEDSVSPCDSLPVPKFLRYGIRNSETYELEDQYLKLSFRDTVWAIFKKTD